jgi:hypothetical protein
MTHEEMLSVATRVVSHASELPPGPEEKGADVLWLAVEDLKAIVVSALREFEEDATASR